MCNENKEVIEGKKDKEKDSVFLNESALSNITQLKANIPSRAEMNRIKVFRYIEEHQPINIYQVSKGLKMSYNTVSYIIRDLIFAGVVHSHVSINDDNVACKILTIPKLGGENDRTIK